MESILETITQSELVHIDSERDVVFETPSTDVVDTISKYFEDTVKKCEGSSAEPPSPLSDSDSGDSLFLTQSVTPVLRTVKRHRLSERPALSLSLETDDESEGGPNEGVSRPHKPRPAYVRPNRTEFPFLKNFRKPRSGRLSVRKNQILVNSEIGGFFKCVQKISQGHEVQRGKLFPSLFPSELEEDFLEGDSTEEDHENDDIKVVDTECFIFNAHKRNRQTWLPKSRWQTKLKQAKEQKNEQKQRTPKRKRAKGITGVQEHTETLSKMDTTLPNNSTSQCKTKEKKNNSSKSVARISFSSPECSSTRSLLIDQEEHSEQQLEVLAACSQSQFLDRHHSRTHPDQQLAESSEYLPVGESDNIRVVEETQRPDSDQASLEAEETSATEMVEDRSKERGEDGICLKNIPFRELQESNKVTGEDIQHELQEDEELNLDSGVSIGSQDLFEQEGNQTDVMIASSLLDEIRVRDGKEDQESCVVQCDERNPLRKKNIMAEQADMAIETDSPFFNYGGLTLLKRRKRKKAETSVPSQSSLSDAGQNDSSSQYDDVCGQKRRKKVGQLNKDNEEEENVDAGLLREPAQAILSPDTFQHSEANFAAVAKEKGTEERDVQSLHHNSEGTYVEEENQITYPTSEGLVSVVEPEQLTVPGLSTPVRNGGQQGGSTDINKVRKSLVQLEGFEPHRIKKAKKRELKSVLSDYLITTECDEQVESSHGTPIQKPAEKKRPGLLEDSGERRVKDISSTTNIQSETLNNYDMEANRGNQGNCLDVQADDLVTPRKKKKKKREQVVVENVDLEANQIETTEQVETREVVQDPEQQATELVPEKRKKKKKRKQEHDIETNVTVETSEVDTTMQIEERKLKKKKKRERVEYNVGEEAFLVEATDSEKQTTESVPEKKLKKKKKREQIVENNVSIKAIEQVEALGVVQDHQPQATELVPEKKLKKKKKREQIVENNVSVEATEQVEALDVVQHHQPQATELVPEKKVKKKKKERHEVAEENMNQMESTEQIKALEVIQDSEQEAGELVPKKKQKKKKNRVQVVEETVDVETTQVATAEHVEPQELIQETEQQSAELVPEIKVKKKKKKRNSEVVEENVALEARRIESTEQIEALELIQETEQQSTELVPEMKVKKKKKRKSEVVEENVDIEPTQVATAEHAETLKLIQEAEQESTPEIKVKKKKKKKKKKSEVVEENVDIEASQIETTELVDALELIQEQKAVELAPEKRTKLKKKKEKVGC